MARRVLAVDSEKEILRLLQVNLERAGYQVDLARNGTEALERMREAVPDLLVYSARLPATELGELLEWIEASGNKDRIEVREIGTSQAIRKPL